MKRHGKRHRLFERAHRAHTPNHPFQPPNHHASLIPPPTTQKQQDGPEALNPTHIHQPAPPVFFPYTHPTCSKPIATRSQVMPDAPTIRFFYTRVGVGLEMWENVSEVIRRRVVGRSRGNRGGGMGGVVETATAEAGLGS